MFFFCQVIVNMGNNEMNWNYTNGAIKAQIAAAAKKAENNALRAAAKKAENNARAEAVRQSAQIAAAAREAAANKVRKNREAAAKKAANNAAAKKLLPIMHEPKLCDNQH
jgi:hypothetical protein